MSGPSLALRPADERALPYVERLLDENGLPSADVRSKPGAFYVGYVADEPVGVGGIEVRGAAGLLRSVVVESSARGNGVGTALCDALEARARDDGVETLYLLTTTAADFFAARGYATIDRRDAPPAIRETDQFADLCPETAVCMKRAL